MDTQHLRIFIEVARQGSFAAAARKLDLATSQVTRAVAGIEAELGVRLLHRTTRKAGLTAAGSEYFARMCDVMDAFDAAADDLQTRTTEARGLVRLTASVALGQRLVLPLLEPFHRQHPGVELDLRFNDRVVDLIDQHVDVALRQSPTLDGSLVGVRLGASRYRVCASPAYLRRHGTPQTPAHLAGHACLRIALPGYSNDWSFRERGKAGAEIQKVPVTGWLAASSALSLLQAARDGMGPVLLADWLLQPDLAAGTLVDLFPRHEATVTDFEAAIWLVYTSREHLPRRVRVVVDFLRAELPRQIEPRLELPGVRPGHAR
ncbi:LysR family transcriptional regulator [Pigmentiphaga litoralis]|uniref:LysR family transcriptional regulator n=1 Tax=Pigmentiphaga litoralis TaxID=516702 RepID=UPI00167989EC|nr:LysR family transcriptional regulator [Pigmentiphaga litoralis]GGX09439.1 LysR family transcriptional regulator [Pigmentiphaga litoralis]